MSQRTREQMMLDEAKAYARADPAIPRRRSKYQFPHLEGYMGPPPPDERTILARQEEQERQKPPHEYSSSDTESSSSSLDSLDDEDDDEDVEEELEQDEGQGKATEDVTENTTEQMNLDTVQPDAHQPTQPDSDPQSTTVNDRTGIMVPAAQAALDDAIGAIEIPEYVFSAEALGLARENATRIRATLEQQEELHQSHKNSTEEILKQFQTSLSEEMKKTTDLKAELATAKAESAKLSQDLASERVPAAAKQKEIERTEKENAQLRQINRKGELQVNELQAVNKKVNAEAARLRNELDKSKVAVPTPVVEKSEEADKKPINMSQAQLDTLQAQARTLQAQNSDLTRDLESAKGDVEAAHHTYEELVSELQEKTKECNQLKSIATEKAKTMSKLKDTITQMEEQIENDRKEIQRLRSNTPVPTHALPPRPPLPYPPSPAPSSNAASNNGNNNNNNLTTNLSHLRASHIRLAGALKGSIASHTNLHTSIQTFHKTLEADDLTMRGVKAVAKAFMAASEKLDAELKVAGEKSEEVKGGVMGVWDAAEGVGAAPEQGDRRASVGNGNGNGRE